MTEISRPLPQAPEPLPEINFALVLSRMIDSLERNPEELRATIYELARVKLTEQLAQEGAEEAKRLSAALEQAIAGVENFSREEHRKKVSLAAEAQSHALLAGPETAKGAGLAIDARDRSGQAGKGLGASDIEGLHDRQQPAYRTRRPLVPAGTAARLTLVLVVGIAVASLALAWSRMRHQSTGDKSAVERAAVSKPERTAAPAQAASADPPLQAKPPPPLPLPATYGIYAISDNRLFELKPLAGKVPDSRVAVSTAIMTPSATTLSDGGVKFVIFRRDSATVAPDHVDVRFVAKVTRAMNVDGAGKAKMAPAGDSWTIRNVMLPYKVGPIDDRPEMLLVTADDGTPPLPAGRYVVVVKGIGYDFTIAGPVTDPRHCMERLDAVNGVFYSPCPQAPGVR